MDAVGDLRNGLGRQVQALQGLQASQPELLAWPGKAQELLRLIFISGPWGRGC